MRSSNDTLLELEVIYETDKLIAINKPHGLLVHRSKIANDAKEFALQLVRDHVGHFVHPVHRLDRKTSGVLLFAKSKEVKGEVQKLFHDRKVEKTYLALVRGFTPSTISIDYPLTENGKTQDAETQFKTLEYFEIELPFGKFPTSRYSLIEVKPSTGRFHQIRKHMKHIFHPIIGDRPHGCNKQNKLWLEKFGLTKMMLHAQHLSFNYPAHNPVTITASKSKKFLEIEQLLQDGNILT